MRFSKKQLSEIIAKNKIQLDALPEKLGLLEVAGDVQIFRQSLDQIINQLISIYDDFMFDLDDEDDNFSMSIDSERGTGHKLLVTTMQFKKELGSILPNHNPHIQSGVREIISVVEGTLTCLGVKIPEPSILTWHNKRLRMEQEKLHSNGRDKDLIAAALQAVKSFTERNQLSAFTYICTVTEEAGNVRKEHDRWTIQFVDTLINDLKKAGVNVASSSKFFAEGTGAAYRYKTIVDAEKLIAIGTESFLLSQQQNSAVNIEMRTVLNRALYDNVPLISLSLSGPKLFYTLPNYDLTPLTTGKYFRDAQRYSYLDTLEYFLVYLYGIHSDPAKYQTFKEIWDNIIKDISIPQNGLSQQAVEEQVDQRSSRDVFFGSVATASNEHSNAMKL